MARSASPAANPRSALRRDWPGANHHSHHLFRVAACRAPHCGRAGRARIAAATDGGADAADRAQLSGQFLRRHAGRWYSGTDLSARPAGADRGPSAPPRAHSGQRRSRFHRYRCAGQGRRFLVARRSPFATRNSHPGRTRAGTDGAALPCCRRRYRLPAIHLRQHRRPEGRRSHPRQPARQPARHECSDRREQRGCVRFLATALPRHGPDRRLVRVALLRHAAGADVSTGLSHKPGALARRHISPRRNDLRCAEFCLRIVREKAQRRRSARIESRHMATGVERRRAGQPEHARSLCHALCALRPPTPGADPGLWPGRMLGRAGLSAAGPWAAH